MARRERIRRFTAEELAGRRAKGEDKTDWAKVDAKTEGELAGDTASDPAWRDVPEDWVDHARAATGPLMRPSENKRLVSVRYDADVVDFFRGQGRGWQARMNAVLRSFMESSRRERG
jgi:uncharacterized protein (DUF4415 family)